MRVEVLPDPSLARHAGRFVWLDLDTDDPRNAAFLERVPVQALPTFLLLDPRGEQVLLRWPGSLTVAQLDHLLDDAERAWRGGGAGPEIDLARGDALFGAGKSAEAAVAFRAALDAAPADWPRRARTVESYVGALAASDDPAGCAREALDRVPLLPRGPWTVNVTGHALSCALELPKEDPTAAGLRGALEALAREALADASLEVVADDRSGLFGALVDARTAAGDAEGSRRDAAAWLSFLEAEAGRAKTPEARSVFDSHRVVAALALGEPARALPALQASERDLPDDYNAAARQVLLFRALGRLDEALAASDRALAKVRGARRVRVLVDRADVLLARTDVAGARRALEDAIAFAESLAPAQRPRHWLGVARSKLATLAPPPPTEGAPK